MYLHNDKQRFVELINEISRQTKIEAVLIEKDYFVTLFLKRLVELEPLTVFKGGTSLSKCFKIIDRFSEDIDINLENVNSLSQGRKKKVKTTIEQIIGEYELTFLNPEQIRSGWTHNSYLIGYNSQIANSQLNIIVETMFLTDAFPTNRMQAGSIIYDYLFEGGYTNVIEQYNLQPFDVTVQALERTFIEKIFALASHYLQNQASATDRLLRQSRHLYDIFKILPYISLDQSLRNLLADAREAWRNRKGTQAGLKAAEEVENLPALLREIVDQKVYKDDYEQVTAPLLYEQVSYDDAICSFNRVIQFLEFQPETRRKKSDMEM